MRIGHASISENKNNGRDGRAKAGDQTGKEVCIRSFYKKPWKYLLRYPDRKVAEKMAAACESICSNENVGYDQSQRLTLRQELQKLNFDYKSLNTPCECDCSSLMTACAECAGIKIQYPGGNAPVTANMVKLFTQAGFKMILEGINEEANLMRGDILVGPPNTHTVMVLDYGTPKHIQTRRTLKRGSIGSDVIYVQKILVKMGYSIGSYGTDGHLGKDTEKAIKQFQGEHGLVTDGIVGVKTWAMLEEYN